MSKYIKLDDAEKLLTNALRIAQGFDEPLERSLVDLPTIEVSEDAISREDAVNALIAHFIPQTYTGEQVEQASKLAWKIMANAPSVIPQPKEGEWIKATGVAPPEFTGRYICSNCGDYALMDMPYGSRQKLSRYCPSCRARMKGADDERSR